MGRVEPHDNPSILVTGGGGFLGKAIIQRLLNEGFTSLKSFSRQAYPALESLGVTQVQGDLGDFNAVDRACRGVDLVFHTAAKAGVWGPYEAYHRTNVLGTEHLISACRKHGVGRLIYTSSASAIFTGKNMEGGDETLPYPETFLTAYPKTKALAEQRVVKATDGKLLTLVLRPHLIWGPGDHHLVPRILERAERLFQVGDGRNVADTIYIDNAAEAHVQAARKLKENPGLSGKIYFISQDDQVPVWEMINRILTAGGKRPVTRKKPPGAAYALGAFLEVVYTLFRLPSEPPMTRFVARELSTSHWYNISAAKRDLDFHPSITTDQGMAFLADWLQEISAKGE